MDTDVKSYESSDVEEDINGFFDTGNLLDQWLLVRTPYPVGFILISYLVFVLKVGPHFMTSRKPYICKTLLRIYNTIQVCYNVWMLHEILIRHNLLPIFMDITCSLKKHQSDEHGKYLFLYFAWHYKLLKILDLFDTVFMVLRKKNSHISFLHMYHHVSMVSVSWIILKYFKSHHGIIPCLLNITVHAVMYSYYLLATFSSLKEYLWWKVYLTKLQMSQFVLILAYLLYIYWKGCPMSKMFNYCVGFVVFTFLCLFTNFYIKTYIQTPKKQEEKQL